MIARDIPEVLAIEAETSPAPWTDDFMLTALRRRNVIGMVAEHGERIVGYMIYELERKSVTAYTFAVDPAYRRRGIGRQLLGKLAAKLAPHRRTHLFVECRETNLGGQLFFRAMGMRATAVMREHFEDTGEDAIRFTMTCKDDARHQLGFRECQGC